MTLQFLFFDGEESFITWRGTDHTYGSRHLAKVWEKQDILKGIEVLMLFDLLGSKEPAIFPLEHQSMVRNWLFYCFTSVEYLGLYLKYSVVYIYSCTIGGKN